MMIWLKLHNKVSADEFQMTMTPARPARWIANGRIDLALVAIEIARGPRIPVPSGYWSIEAITGCGHRMAHSGLAASTTQDATGSRPFSDRADLPGSPT
jgi:hypothetical protein